MKEVVDEGLRMFLGQRHRVSLANCSLERLHSMLEQIDAETLRLKEDLEVAEQEVLALYESADDVHLEYSAGLYQFPLDQCRERLSDDRQRIEDLFEKRGPIFKAYQEKYLEQQQVKLFGSVEQVRLKDRFIFALIILVLIILAIDAGNIGATGSGAVLKPVVENGKVTWVDIVNPGKGYRAALVNVKVSSYGQTGKGFEATVGVKDGKVTSVTVDKGGENYASPPELVVRPTLSLEIQQTFWLIDFVCCIFFLANFFMELSRAACRKWYWKTHWIDFLTSIPLPPAHILANIGFSGSEAIRAGRLLRVLRLLRALRALRLFLFMWRGLDHFAELFDVQLMKKSFGAALGVLLIGAVLITLFGEKGEGHEAVGGFLPGLWWSFTTLVTGGFGDIYNPETLLGRLLTVFLVLAGMVLVGVFTATLTTILVGKEERAQTAMQNEVLERIRKEGSRTEEAIQRVEVKQSEIAERIDELESKADRSENDK